MIVHQRNRQSVDQVREAPAFRSLRPGDRLGGCALRAVVFLECPPMGDHPMREFPKFEAMLIKSIIHAFDELPELKKPEG